MKDIQQQLHQATGNMEHAMQLMQQLKETQELRNMIAKKLGSELTS